MFHCKNPKIKKADYEYTLRIQKKMLWGAITTSALMQRSFSPVLVVQSTLEAFDALGGSAENGVDSRSGAGKE
jgi:hypothetical protein